MIWSVRVKKVVEYWTEVEADSYQEAVDNAIDEAEFDNMSGWTTIDDFVTDIDVTELMLSRDAYVVCGGAE